MRFAIDLKDYQQLKINYLIAGNEFNLQISRDYAAKVNATVLAIWSSDF